MKVRRIGESQVHWRESGALATALCGSQLFVDVQLSAISSVLPSNTNRGSR